jgi:hypothetical protein
LLLLFKSSQIKKYKKIKKSDLYSLYHLSQNHHKSSASEAHKVTTTLANNERGSFCFVLWD